MSHLVLASASPRRSALLRELGVAFTVHASELPEVRAPHERAPEFAKRVAREKAAAVAARFDTAWVLAADTIVVVDDAVLGKPANDADARAMLGRLSARAHEVLTAVVLLAPGGRSAAEVVTRSRVVFRPLGADEIAAYVATGEPRDKAGAYAIQGGAAGFVERISGSYTNIVGLPLDEVQALLREHGLLPAHAAGGTRA